MFKRRFRVIAAVVSATMLLGGCASTVEQEEVVNEVSQEGVESEDSYFNKEGTLICDEPITVTFSGAQGSSKDWQNTAQIKFIKEAMGIDIQCQPITDDAWQTQLTLMAAKHSFTDIVTSQSTSVMEANEYGIDGYLLPINEYLEYMPNFSEKLEQNPDYAKSITAEDGNIYTISKLVEPLTRNQLQRVYINETWLDNLGLEVPSTLDELYEVLTAFKNEDANGNGDSSDEIPMLYQDDIYYWLAQEAILSAYGIYSKEKDYILQLGENEQLYLANATDEYREFLIYMNKLYTEGLMEPEAFVITKAEVCSKEAEDIYGFFGTVSAPYVMASKDMSYDFEWAITPTFTLNEDDEKFILKESVAASSAMIMISANTQYPEALCRMMDYFFTDTGAYLGSQGVEGETIEFVEVEQMPGEVTSAYIDWESSGYATATEFKQQYSIIQGAFYVYDTSYGIIDEGLLDLSDEDFYNLYNDLDFATTYTAGWALLAVEYCRNNEFTFLEAMPIATYTSAEAKSINTYKTDIESYLKTTKAQFITGELDPSGADWDTYLATLDKMGFNELMELEQSAFDRTYE